jgi:hypothetical protein
LRIWMMMTIDDDDELLSLRSPQLRFWHEMHNTESGSISLFFCLWVLGLNGRKGVECALHADLRNNMC